MNARQVWFVVLLYCVIQTLAGCVAQSIIYEGGRRVSQRRYDADMQTFQPYRELNTLDGYHEFLRLYPDNIFTLRALDEINVLEFKPYEQQDTVEGYLEFKMRYPGNPNVKKANWRIEQVEIRRYDSLDTPEGYREFLQKYPRSIFADSARERLQELSFREQDKLLRRRCGFDLLKYRHDIRKAAAAGGALWDFEIFARVSPRNGRDRFVTRLLYSTPPDFNDGAQIEQLKAGVLSRLLGLIGEQVKSGAKVPPPEFEVCRAPQGFDEGAAKMLSYEVAPNGLRLLASDRCRPQELLELASVEPAPPSEPSAGASGSPAGGAAVQPSPPSAAAQPEPSPVVVYAPPSNPVEIMRRVASSNSFTDAVLSRRWETKFSDGRAKDIAVIEKHRRYAPRDDVRCATVLRYLETRNTRSDTRRCASAILFQRSPKDGDRYWYIYYRGDAGRTLNIETYRPDAENNFFLEQYVDLLPESESHELLEIVTNDGRPAALIRSVPLTSKPYYAWRRSLIDLERMVPIMIEYYDGRNELQKDVTFSWQQCFGIWYWDVAMFRNLADGSTTRITTTDIRINLGLADSDFQPGALRRMTGR